MPRCSVNILKVAGRPGGCVIFQSPAAFTDHPSAVYMSLVSMFHSRVLTPMAFNSCLTRPIFSTVVVTSCSDYANSTLDFVPLHDVINAVFHSTGAKVYLFLKKKFIKMTSNVAQIHLLGGGQAVMTGSVLEEVGGASISSAISCTGVNNQRDETFPRCCGQTRVLTCGQVSEGLCV